MGLVFLAYGTANINKHIEEVFGFETVLKLLT